MISIPIAPTPDALMAPEEMKKGRNHIERVHFISRLVEPLLEVNYPAGERAQIHKQLGGWLFITKDAHDTIYMPDKSGMGGQPRYAWVPRPDGMRFGYLTQAAKDYEARRKQEEASKPFNY